MKYKVKDCFEMKNVAGDNVIIARGAAAIDFSAVIVLNETGAFLWELLADFTDKEAMVLALVKKYGVSSDVVEPDVEAYIAKMSENGLLDISE